MLTASGYIESAVGGVVQPESALQTIVALLQFAPMIVWALVLVVAAFYRLDKKYAKIMADLAEREARGEM